MSRQGFFMVFYKRYWCLGCLVGMFLFLIWGLAGCTFFKEESRIYQSESGTMERLLEVIQHPIGQTMYVWGGGWDSGDAKAGHTATQIGLDSQWIEFAQAQGKDYDFEEYLEQQELGLDCSGYVGWVIYNLFEEHNGEEGYVVQSTGMAENYANRGWGHLICNPRDFLPGDIVSMQGHVWISLGTCSDGSVLLVHSSPPGVSICGTVSPKEDGQTSIAVRMATEYMTTKYPEWQSKYPKRTVPISYLERANVLRWNGKTLQNVADYQALSGEEIMELLMKYEEN